MSKTVDDVTIATLLRAGRPEALAALSERYRARLILYVGRVLSDPVEAEDIAQEVLLRARQSAGPRAGTSLAGWLYAVAYRLSIDRLRTRDRRIRLLAQAPVEITTPEPSMLEQREQVNLLAEALHDLPDPYRTAVTLRYLEGREFRDIAHLMGTVDRTARTWVGRGLTRLRRKLGVEA